MRSLLICHSDAPLDVEGLSAWLASFSDLCGLVVLEERADRMRKRVERELKRVGNLRFVDVLAFRLYYRVALANKDSAWEQKKLRELRSRYGKRSDNTPIHVSHSPNTDEVRDFIREQAPDIMIARCKFILKKSIFSIPTLGTFVLHPGICPEYRNAHGGFWALAQDDVDKVGTTLLRIDEGVDTGPVYGYFSYDYDERGESHIVIQQRTLFDNLEAIRERFLEIESGQAEPLDTTGRSSGTYGQPWMTKYLRWKLKARFR